MEKRTKILSVSTSVVSAALMLFLASGCDKVEAPYLKPVKAAVATDTLIYTDTLAKNRIVLLEEFTGHTCGNCPKAGEIALSLEDKYGAALVPVTIHAGSFAAVSGPGTVMEYDFTCAASNEYFTFFGNPNNPSGMISRKGYPATNIMSSSQWDAAIGAIVNAPVAVNVYLATHYDSTSRKLSIGTKTKFLGTPANAGKLVVLITEDSIVKPQIDYRLHPDTVYSYTHHNVLRTAVNTSWGEDVATGAVGSSVEKTYSITLDTGWNHKNCYVVAFYYDATTYEVIQASRKKL